MVLITAGMAELNYKPTYLLCIGAYIQSMPRVLTVSGQNCAILMLAIQHHAQSSDSALA